MLYAHNQFSALKKRPRPAAFNPYPHSALSVIHVTGMGDIAVWEVGRYTLGTQPGRDKIYARADVPVAELLKQHLTAFLDNKPFKRHTSIVGWPDESDPIERKARWKQICIALSASPEVLLVIPSSPIVKTEA